MSVLTAFQKRYGAEVGFAGIVKKCSTVKSPAVLAQLMETYLDEAKKHERTLPPANADSIPESDYADLILDGGAPLRPGLDYISEFPGVLSFGRVSLALARLTGDTSNRPTPANLEVIKRWWLEETADVEKRAYHLVFSMDPRLVHRLCNRGIAADGVILSAALSALRAYGSRHYPGDLLGGLIGVHFEKAHPHGHALLFPRTAAGKCLNLSPLSSAVVGKEKTRIDFQGSLQQAFFNECSSVAASLSLSRPVPAAELLQEWLLVRSVAVSSQAGDADLSDKELAERVEADPDWLHRASAIAEQDRVYYLTPRKPTTGDHETIAQTLESHATMLSNLAFEDTRIEQLMSRLDQSPDWIEKMEQQLARTRALDGELFELSRILTHVGHNFTGLIDSKAPFFLQQPSPQSRILPNRNEVDELCVKLVNDAGAREDHARRPFSLEEMGRVLQCPYPVWSSSRKRGVPEIDEGRLLVPSAAPVPISADGAATKVAPAPVASGMGHADSQIRDDRNRAIFESIAEEIARARGGMSRSVG